MKQAPISAEAIPALMGKTNYPEPYASLVKGRLKRKLGDFFGLTNFGLNLTHSFTRRNLFSCPLSLEAG